MKKFIFATSCVNAVSGEDIREMVDICEDLSTENFIYRTARAHGIDEEILESLGYEEWAQDSNSGAKKLFSNDYGLSCHKSLYQGIPCFYVAHSRIEHIYIPESNQSKLLEKKESTIRSMELDTLREEWDNLAESLDLMDIPHAKGLAKFSKAHEKTLVDHQIPVQSVVSDCSEDLIKLGRRLDAKIRLRPEIGSGLSY